MIVQVSSQTPPTARELLLDAARYLFWEKGYAATGVAELLQRAHVNSGSFYHVFPSKEALLLAAQVVLQHGQQRGAPAGRAGGLPGRSGASRPAARVCPSPRSDRAHLRHPAGLSREADRKS